MDCDPRHHGMRMRGLLGSAAWRACIDSLAQLIALLSQFLDLSLGALLILLTPGKHCSQLLLLIAANRC